MLKCIKLVLLLSCIAFMSSCTWYDVLRTTVEVVEHIPPDTYFEDEILEPFIEDKLGLEKDSLDLTPFSAEE